MLGQAGTLLDSVEKRKRLGKVMVFTLLGGCAIFSFYHWNRFMWEDHKIRMFSPAFFLVGEQGSYFTNNIPETDIAKSAEKIGELTGYGINNIFLSRSYGNTVMYYGKVFGVAWPTEDDINFRKRNGNNYPPAGELYATKYAHLKPKFFIITDLREWESQTDLKEFLNNTYRIFAKEDRFIIYDLRNKKPAFSAGPQLQPKTSEINLQL
jgi:hypothetical protein